MASVGFYDRIFTWSEAWMRTEEFMESVDELSADFNGCGIGWEGHIQFCLDISAKRIVQSEDDLVIQYEVSGDFIFGAMISKVGGIILRHSNDMDIGLFDATH